MRKLIVAISTLAFLLTPVAASAAPYKLPASYRAVYCYNGGTYWAAQKAAYPEYYAANSAYFKALYGAGTMYCPAN